MSTTTRPRRLARGLGLLMAPLVWLERAKGRRRLALVALYLLVAAVVGAVAWHVLCLRGLPDVGDPFDVAAFERPDVPDAENAMPLYREAVRRLVPPADEYQHLISPVWQGRGDPSAAPLLAWSAANREALALWRRGTERPGAFDPPDAPFGYPMAEGMRWLGMLASLEALRLEARGDLEGAWGWYRAMLRASRHLGRRGTYRRLAMSQVLLTQAEDRILGWAARADVGAPLLRRALAEARAIDAMTAPPSETLKAEYLEALRALDAVRAAPRLPGRPEPGEGEWYAFLPLYPLARMFFRNEPERSRRVVRLIFANRLAYADRPPATRPWLVAPGIHDTAADPAAPAGARRLPPAELAAWYDSALFVANLRGHWATASDPHDRSLRRRLILDLARALHRREHPEAPPTDAALIALYGLDDLPDGVTYPGDRLNPPTATAIIIRTPPPPPPAMSPAKGARTLSPAPGVP
jgi:hypothetical protein